MRTCEVKRSRGRTGLTSRFLRSYGWGEYRFAFTASTEAMKTVTVTITHSHFFQWYCAGGTESICTTGHGRIVAFCQRRTDHRVTDIG